ncbi:MAG: hypothetical protein HY606_12995 [Planctomycetes bacterium]|nr:hypothetical protein [Planctomycetota bacterium]
MHEKPCYRCIDKPISICGLEIDDLIVVLLVSGLIYFFCSGIAAVASGIVNFIALRKLKEGRPRGYLFFIVYRAGFFNLWPAFIRPSYIFQLRSSFRTQIFLSGISSVSESEFDSVKFWYNGQRLFK